MPLNLTLQDKIKIRNEQLRLIEVLERIAIATRLHAIKAGVLAADIPTRPTIPPDNEQDT